MTIFIEYENEILPYDSFEAYLDWHSIEDKIPSDVVCMWDEAVFVADAIIARPKADRETLQARLDEHIRDAKESREHIKQEMWRGRA